MVVIILLFSVTLTSLIYSGLVTAIPVLDYISHSWIVLLKMHLGLLSMLLFQPEETNVLDRILSTDPMVVARVTAGDHFRFLDKVVTILL